MPLRYHESFCAAALRPGTVFQKPQNSTETCARASISEQATQNIASVGILVKEPADFGRTFRLVRVGFKAVPKDSTMQVNGTKKTMRRQLRNNKTKRCATICCERGTAETLTASTLPFWTRGRDCCTGGGGVGTGDTGCAGFATGCARLESASLAASFLELAWLACGKCNFQLGVCVLAPCAE